MSKRSSFAYRYVVAIAVCGLGALDSVRAADSGPLVGYDLGWARYPQNYYTVVPSGTEVPSATILTNSTLDRNRLAWSISAGYRFNRYLNLEAAYVDLGSIAGPLTNSSGAYLDKAQLRFSAQGETLAAVGLLPLGQWDLFFKGGVLFSDTLLQIGGKDTSSQTQHPLAGFGIQRHFAAKWSARVAFTGYQSVGSTSHIHGPSVHVLTGGVTYGF